MRIAFALFVGLFAVGLVHAADPVVVKEQNGDISVIPPKETRSTGESKEFVLQMQTRLAEIQAEKARVDASYDEQILFVTKLILAFQAAIATP